MSRNRFQLLLKFWHFADNTQVDDNNRPYKCQAVLDMFIEKFKDVYIPGRSICVDESMVPWKGRLKFRQYIPSKKHRYGMKLYKLCTAQGYNGICQFTLVRT